MAGELIQRLTRALADEPGLSVAELFDQLAENDEAPAGPALLRAALRANRSRFNEENGYWYALPVDPDAPGLTSPTRAPQAVASRPTPTAAPRAMTTASAGGRSLWGDEEEDAIGDCDRELRERLRGRRVVAEIGLDAALLERVEDILQEELKWRTPEQIARDHPAIFVTYLVGHGVYHYAAGGLWQTLTLPKIDQSNGADFLKAVKKLRLETFEDLVAGDGAQRFVGPIIAHGGIPKYCLDDYFLLVFHGLRQGADDALDLMTTWRTRKSAFAAIDKPVRRFLLYGGQLATDFLDRTIDLIRTVALTDAIPSPEQAGLPTYVLNGFNRHRAQAVDVSARMRLGVNRLPRPVLVFQAWGADCPALRLPPIAEHFDRHVTWRVFDGSRQRLLDISRRSERFVPLTPARAWTVDLADDEEVHLSVTLEGLDELAMLCFDARSNVALPLAAGIRADEIVLVYPPKAVDSLEAIGNDGSRSPLAVIEELPELTGDWSGYTASRVATTDVRALAVTRGGDERRLAVRPPAALPQLVGIPLPRVVTTGGLAVFDVAPCVGSPDGADMSRVRVRCDDDAVIDLAVPGSSVDLAKLLPATRAATVSVLARGALGSDTHLRFGWVPGAVIKRPDTIALPRDGEIAIHASSAALDLGSIGRRIPVHMSDGFVELVIEPGGLPIRVIVPRLLWGFAGHHETSPALDGAVVRLDAGDLVGKRVDHVVVRTGKPGVDLSLSLRAGGIEQSTDRVRTVGDPGRWSFALAPFIETIRATPETSLAFVLWLGAVPVTIAEVRPALDVSGLVARADLAEGIGSVEVTFDESRPLRNRALRLWSMSRPWEPPLSTPIPDDQTGVARLRSADLVAGKFRAEVAVDDGWTAVVRPHPADKATAAVTVGTPDELTRRLGDLDLDDPCNVLEIACTVGERARELTDNEATIVADELLQAVATVLADRHGASGRPWAALTSFVGRSGAALAHGFVRLVGDDLVHGANELHLAIRLLAEARRYGARTRDEVALLRLWSTEPVLGATLDCERTNERAERSRQFLGWDPDGDDSIPVGGHVGQMHLGMDADRMQEQRRFMDLVPGFLLSIDSHIIATFEWLEAEKKTRRAERAWVDGQGLLSSVPDDPLLAIHLAARATPRGTEARAALPQVCLAAAAHLIADTCRVEAMSTLLDLATWAPRLVRRDLVLATVILDQWKAP